MSGGVRWRPGGGYLLPALIPPEPLMLKHVWGMKQSFIWGHFGLTKDFESPLIFDHVWPSVLHEIKFDFEPFLPENLKSNKNRFQIFSGRTFTTKSDLILDLVSPSVLNQIEFGFGFSSGFTAVFECNLPYKFHFLMQISAPVSTRNNLALSRSRWFDRFVRTIIIHFPDLERFVRQDPTYNSI